MGRIALLHRDHAVGVRRRVGLERARRRRAAVPAVLALVVAAGVALRLDAALRDGRLDLAAAFLAGIPAQRSPDEDRLAVGAELELAAELAEHFSSLRSSLGRSGSSARGGPTPPR